MEYIYSITLSQQFNLPVCLPLEAGQSWPPNYMSYFHPSSGQALTEGPFKWMDSRRPVFTVSTKVVSKVSALVNYFLVFTKNIQICDFHWLFPSLACFLSFSSFCGLCVIKHARKHKEILQQRDKLKLLP